MVVYVVMSLFFHDEDKKTNRKENKNHNPPSSPTPQIQFTQFCVKKPLVISKECHWAHLD